MQLVITLIRTTAHFSIVTFWRAFCFKLIPFFFLFFLLPLLNYSHWPGHLWYRVKPRNVHRRQLAIHISNLSQPAPQGNYHSLPGGSTPDFLHRRHHYYKPILYRVRFWELESNPLLAFYPISLLQSACICWNLPTSVPPSCFLGLLYLAV